MSTRRALALAIFVLGVGAAPPAAAEWRRIDSPNFVVTGDVSAQTLRSVAIEFEGFRETLTRVMTERATSTPVPTIVIVFPSDRAFIPFKPLYHSQPDKTKALFAYLDRVSEGGQPMAVWKEAFGAANVERELEEYVRQHSFQAVL